MKIVKDRYLPLTLMQKQKFIKLIKDKFEQILSKKLTLTRVSAPLLVTQESGLQDDLSGVERKVSFDIKKDGKQLEIVQSLAKWKRFALKKYQFPVHTGLYTDMTAIRRDDDMDELHSIYVDQWDWEKVITKEDRTLEYLKSTVSRIVEAIVETSKYVEKSGVKAVEISPDVHFITSQDLLKMYPDKTPKEREYLITKEYKTVFIMQIGGELTDGKPHDLRAPDYDDWGLDGDLLFFHEVLDRPIEISSMGIRVDKKSLIRQLILSKCESRLEYEYHKQILGQELPLSIGGGIGQSRLCMLLLGRAHIGEVQASYWDETTLKECKEAKIELL